MLARGDLGESIADQGEATGERLDYRSTQRDLAYTIKTQSMIYDSTKSLEKRATRSPRGILADC